MNNPSPLLPDHLSYLKLAYFLDQHRPLADQAAREQWSHGDYLARLADGEVQQRQEQSLKRRIRAARFPWVKTLEAFQWSWPKKINRVQVQHLFGLGFLETHASIVFCGGVGLGIMPGSGLCRALWDLPPNRRPKPLSTRHNPRRIDSYKFRRN